MTRASSYIRAWSEIRSVGGFLAGLRPAEAFSRSPGLVGLHDRIPRPVEGSLGPKTQGTGLPSLIGALGETPRAPSSLLLFLRPSLAPLRRVLLLQTPVHAEPAAALRRYELQTTPGLASHLSFISSASRA